MTHLWWNSLIFLPKPHIGCPYPCRWVLGGHGCDIIGNVINFEYMGAIWIICHAMGGHRSLLMGVVLVWVKIRRKCWALTLTNIGLVQIVMCHVHVHHDPIVSHVETTFWHMYIWNRWSLLQYRWIHNIDKIFNMNNIIKKYYPTIIKIVLVKHRYHVSVTWWEKYGMLKSWVGSYNPHTIFSDTKCMYKWHFRDIHGHLDIE